MKKKKKFLESCLYHDIKHSHECYKIFEKKKNIPRSLRPINSSTAGNDCDFFFHLLDPLVCVYDEPIIFVAVVR